MDQTTYIAGQCVKLFEGLFDIQVCLCCKHIVEMNSHFVGFEVFTAVVMKSIIF
jgi:hypothetical protein